MFTKVVVESAIMSWSSENSSAMKISLQSWSRTRNSPPLMKPLLASSLTWPSFWEPLAPSSPCLNLDHSVFSAESPKRELLVLSIFWRTG